MCTCVAGWAGSGHGADGCLWDDPSLSDLVAGGGATLSPVFAPDTTVYVLALPPGVLSATIIATVAEPRFATIRVDGTEVASGAAAEVSAGGLAPRIVNVVVTTDSGAALTYAVVVTRASVYVKASNTGTSNEFGTSVSLSADGTRLAVGAPRERSSATGINGDQTDTGANDTGAVYVFARSGATWVQEVYVKASNAQAGDHFGHAVALSADGARLAISADHERNGGMVYVFSRMDSTWIEEARFRGSNTERSDQFGYALSLSGDGTRIAVGAYLEWSSATGINGNEASNGSLYSGAVYVFSRSGTSWTQDAYVKASNTGNEDRFGCFVSLSGDGTRLAVGANGEDSSATGIDGDQADFRARDSGAVYMFALTGAIWAQEAYIKASNTGGAGSLPGRPGDQFGYSVSLSSDGLRLAVGAPTEDSSAIGVGGDQTDNSAADSGAVYVFAATGTTWVQEVYIKASNTSMTDRFGGAVCLSADGAQLAVGASWESSSARGIGGDPFDWGTDEGGAVYAFTRTGSRWAQGAYIKASNTGAFDTFGASVSLTASGAQLAVGAPFESSNARGIGGDESNDLKSRSGAVYAF